MNEEIKVDSQKANEKKKFNWKKYLKITGITLVVLLFFSVLFRDYVIEFSVENAGSMLLGVPVKMGSFNSSLTNGTVEIKDLTVGNPAGYKSEHAFKLGFVRVDLALDTLLSKMVVVEEITVRGMNVDFELGLGRSNLTDLKNNLETWTAKEKAKKTASSKPAQSVLIKLIQMEENKIQFSNSLLNATVPVPLLPLKLTDIGGEGQSLAETLDSLFGYLIKAISNACANVGGAVGDAVAGLGNKTQDAVKTGGDAVKNAGKNLIYSVKSVINKR